MTRERSAEEHHVDRGSAALIDFTETAYDLALGQEEWLPRLLEVGSFLDHGLGVAAITCRRDPKSGTFEIRQVRMTGCPEDFLVELAVAHNVAPEGFLWKVSRPTVPMTLSEASQDDRKGFEAVIAHFRDAKDGLGMSAFDPDGNGVYLVAPLAKETSLTDRERERWQMVAAHFGAGNRLRRALESEREATSLPHDAEAILDAGTLNVGEALGNAGSSGAIDRLREAAKKVDRARGKLRKEDPATALETWNALVRGRWSMVDWFDSDGRRFMLAVPNAPSVQDPRGLTKQEAQVVSFVVSGHSNKLIGYQLGLSKARVSTVLSTAMRKLKVRTRPELVRSWRDFRAVD